MLTEFPESGKFPRSGIYSLSRDTQAWKRVMTIIKGDASASAQPLMNSCILKNHTRASIFCIYILVIFTSVILLKVWCYFLLFTHSYLAVVVAYDTLLQFSLNANTFRTQIFIYSHFYLIAPYLFSTIFPIYVTHDSSVLVRDGERKRSIIFTKQMELSK